MSAHGAVEDGVGELPEALRAVIQQRMGTMTLVKFDHMRLGDAGAVYVAEKLRGNTIVEELWLVRRTFDVGIGAVGACALAESLGGSNARLKFLTLEENELVGDVGAQAMADMLKQNTTLEVMRLSHCGVGRRGACALGEGLKENDCLKEISLGGNEIEDEGAEALAEMLRWNESLELLGLSDCALTEVGATSLLSALRESNSTLTKLFFEGNFSENYFEIQASIEVLLMENEAVRSEMAERRARCLLFCCLKLAPSAHKYVVPSIGAVPVPVMRYAVEHAGELHVAKRFEVGNRVAGQSSTGVRGRSPVNSFEQKVAKSCV